MNGGVSFTRNIILMSVRLKIRHRVLETWNNKWARNKEIENSQNWKGEQKDFDLAWLKQFCEFRKEKVCAWNVNWMNGGLASISNVAIKTLLASAPPAPCQPVPPPGRVASPRMDRMNTFTTITIIIFAIITTITTITTITSHCYIKALFSVLGGGLPQFNTSDLFLGRESLSYVPPDI